MNKIIKMWDVIWKKGLLHIFAGTFMTKVISFFGSIFLVRVLSKQEYGILGYLDNIYGYAFVFAGMGLSNAILRYVVLAETIQEKYNYFNYAVKKGIVWNVILILCLLIFSGFYPHPAAYQNYIWLLCILIIAVPFQYIIDNVLCNERAMFSNQRYALYSFCFSGVTIISKILFGKWFGIKGVVFSQVCIYIVLAVSFFILTKKDYYSDLISKKLSKSEKSTITRYSLQYMITNGLWAIFMLNDTFLLGRYCAPEIIAEYKVAYTIPGSVSLLSTAIGIFVTPYFVRNENNNAWIRSNYKKTYLITAGVVGAICLIITVLAKPIVLLLYGSEYINVVKIMGVLLIASFFNCGLRYTTANILAAMGKVKYNMIISGIGILLQFSLNIQIIPRFGAMGVAITSCIVYGIMAISLLFIFLKQYYWDNNPGNKNCK
ncbi:oligosaccharide flippase family protein [[Clostridium] symbiosum]|uniref:lipopolysaccharide biosynthesis protein n=1 Tax=Clostridium symbiosum TaxID=1512 RepID=UPI001D08DC6A|nr:oligosaccharide flippase family protein [[Clostridium] symbiosum]MCB6607647.1 oligosaccharide flippase family protein [[Clostridium] symbiosum]MCB6929324.1 oligosaccharide flippase family protein [[Clostridium] symbiosum]